MPTPVKLHHLMDIRSALVAQAEALKAKIEGIDLALSVLKDEPHETEQGRAPRGGVKAALLDLLQEVGESGLNSNTAVELASRKGIQLDRNTVSSLLSRLKADGAVEHDGQRYRLKEQQSPRDVVATEMRAH